MSFFSRLYQKALSPYHYLWAFFSALFLGFPGKRGKNKKIKIIGITGTKGKSTVTEFASKILEKAGYKTAVFSSIKIKIGKREKKNLFKMTMPGRWHIQKFLKDAKNSGCDYAILEVTSEGILQHRQKFIDFDVVVFTNLSPEHIERHGSFENYRKAKEKLFKENHNIHILNLDDENVSYFLKYKAQKKYGFSFQKNLNLKIKNVKVIKGEKIIRKGIQSFKVSNVEFKINLIGNFNLQNALCALCVGFSQGVLIDKSREALERIKEVPGRMEIVVDKPFKVIVDYAHTPQSLSEVYKTLRNLEFQENNSKLICVLGAAGGGRDRWKRSKMGEIASQYCDKIILTNEDPYDEDPNQIIEDIERGINKGVKKKRGKSYIQNLYKILKRDKAISKAFSLAKKDDIVIITGKGCEPWMCIEKGQKIPWDDRKIVKQVIKKYANT